MTTDWKCARLFWPSGRSILVATDGETLRVRGKHMLSVQMRLASCEEEPTEAAVLPDSWYPESEKGGLMGMMKTAESIVCKWKLQGVKFVTLEHALRIPYGSLEEIGEGREPQPEEIALLNMVDHFPWLLDVAGDGFKVSEETRGKILKDLTERQKEE